MKKRPEWSRGSLAIELTSMHQRLNADTSGTPVPALSLIYFGAVDHPECRFGLNVGRRKLSKVGRAKPMHYPGCTKAHKHGAAGNFSTQATYKHLKRNPTDAEIERLIAHHRRLSREAEAAAKKLVGKVGSEPRVHRLLLKAADHSIKVQKLQRKIG